MAASPYYESCEKYDVFISFRGSDIRHGFLSHIQNELDRNNVDVFVDERIERGTEISKALKVAIEASEISLVIFSQGYASSTWCLEELVKIMECKELHRRTVIPIFYNIDPSHVRRQLGTYSDAFAKHEENFQYTSEKLQSWRSALTKTANLSGYTYLSDNQNESKFIFKIVSCIVKKLSGDSKLLDGIYKKFTEVVSGTKIETQIELGSGEKGEDGNSKPVKKGFMGMKVNFSSVRNWTSRPRSADHFKDN
ncbi:hypothetical protein QN277_022405 [Acacia crassicarpa]|uniref:TIR domain-containing protein n=1 Tax=Acacia crassicarpa TaxID=499986 RepID=A0AAE1JEV9_9FABA|nr:hypothetical protein QN277_022405 [Acacia crassicarpa]